MIKNILCSYGIDPEEMHIIYLTDNGSNFVSGLKDEVHLRCICEAILVIQFLFFCLCLGHGLNLVLQYSLGEFCPRIDSMVKACGELVTHFKRCELNSLLPTTLKQQCETRWNSVYDMLQSINLNFKQVEEILLSRKEHAVYMDTIDENLLKQLSELLSYFKKASEQLSADQEPTLHLVLPWINKLKSYCEIRTNDSAVMKQLKKLMLEQIKQKIWLTKLHEIATFLHPLTKNLLVCFEKSEKNQKNECLFTLLQSFTQTERVDVHNATREMLKTVGIAQQKQQSSSVVLNKTAGTRKKKKNHEISQDDILMEFANEDQNDSDEEDDNDEVDEYVKVKLSFSKEQSVLEWWSKCSLNYPQLSLLARCLLGIPASSATSERVFSASGRILEERRQNLSGDIVNDILFLRNFRNM